VFDWPFLEALELQALARLRHSTRAASTHQGPSETSSHPITVGYTITLTNRSNQYNKPTMPAPSPLAIATSVLNRLVKEEVSYHKELEQQNAKIAKLEAGEGADDQNADFILRQQVCIVVVTREIRLYEFLRAS
jgi:hypothetical protein